MSRFKRWKGSVGLCVAAVAVAGLLVGAALLLPGATAHAQGDVIYVDWTADGAADGSWLTDAFTNVQDALDGAGYGKEIWVAQGVYTPETARSDTFTMKPGVALYGGFEATETDRGEHSRTNRSRTKQSRPSTF